jgi:hypothetical protein
MTLSDYPIRKTSAKSCETGCRSLPVARPAGCPAASRAGGRRTASPTRHRRVLDASHPPPSPCCGAISIRTLESLPQGMREVVTAPSRKRKSMVKKMARLPGGSTPLLRASVPALCRPYAGCIGKKGATYAACFRGLMNNWGVSRFWASADRCVAA